MELIKLTKSGETALIEPNDFERFIADGWTAVEAATSKPKRARNVNGTLKSDDPATPENEAWEGGKAPAKATRKKV